MTTRGLLASSFGNSIAGAFALALTLPCLSVDGPAAKHPAFEVAVIKVNHSGGGNSHSSFQHGRFSASNETVKMFVQYDAYGIPAPQIVGGPSWFGSERFDVEAKADDDSAAQMEKISHDARETMQQQMMQQLLADRFHLAVHWETKEIPVYAIVVAKGGPKFAQSTADEGHTGSSSGNGRLKVTGLTMTGFAETLTQVLSRELERVVVDQTGLDGKYDLALNWSSEADSAAASDTGSKGAPSGPSVFTSIQEQLGLKLVSTKGPVRTLVIDHLEPPSEN